MNATHPALPLRPPLFPATAAVCRFLMPRLRAFGRFVFSRKMAYVLLTLIALSVAAWHWENWQGAKAWRAVQADMAQRGLSFSELNLPPVAAEADNVAMHPVFALARQLRNNQPITLQNPPIWEFSKLIAKYAVALPAPQATEKPILAEYADQLAKAGQPLPDAPAEILRATEGLQEYVHGINEAALRPFTQWTPYAPAAGQKEMYVQRPVCCMGGIFEFSQQVGTWLALRAQAQLANNQPNQALETVMAMLHGARLFSRDTGGGLRGGLVDLALSGIYLPRIESCLDHPAWREADLQKMAATLAEVDFSAAPAKLFRYELLGGMQQILNVQESPKETLLCPQNTELWRKLFCYAPKGIYQHNLAAFYHVWTENFLEPARHDGESVKEVPESFCSPGPRNILAALTIPCVNRLTASARATQLLQDKLRLRCLLARHQLVNGKPAASLEEVITTVPVDHATGKPLTLAVVLGNDS